MDDKAKQEWREAYSLAIGIVGKRGIETALLTIGMMFRESLDKNLEKWLSRIAWVESERPKSG